MHNEPTSSLTIEKGVPSPRLNQKAYHEALLCMEPGESFTFPSGDRPLVAAAASKLGYDVEIAKDGNQHRVWLESAWQLDSVARLYDEIVEWSKDEPERESWDGSAAELEALIQTGITPKRLGRSLAVLSRTYGNVVTILRLSPKRGNRYRICLESLRPLVRPVSASEPVEVAETSCAPVDIETVP